MSPACLSLGPSVEATQGRHLSATVGRGQELDTILAGCRVVMVPSSPSQGPHSSLQFGPLWILVRD